MKKIVVLMLMFLSTFALAKDGKWVNLFNGKNLDGWKVLNGNAEFKAENGMIVGSAKLNSPNSFLATEKTFGDFILNLNLRLMPI